MGFAISDRQPAYLTRQNQLVYTIQDRDFRPLSEAEGCYSENYAGRHFMWRRHELENYLIEPRGRCKLLQTVATIFKSHAARHRRFGKALDKESCPRSSGRPSWTSDRVGIASSIARYVSYYILDISRKCETEPRRMAKPPYYCDGRNALSKPNNLKDLCKPQTPIFCKTTKQTFRLLASIVFWIQMGISRILEDTKWF